MALTPRHPLPQAGEGEFESGRKGEGKAMTLEKHLVELLPTHSGVYDGSTKYLIYHVR